MRDSDEWLDPEGLDWEEAGRVDLAEPDQLRLVRADDLAREQLAGNRCIVRAVQDHLATDPTLRVREALASNTSLHPEVQRTLLAQVPEVRIALTRNPAVDPDVLDQLTKDRQREVRAAAASCPRLTPQGQAMLAGDRSWVVREALSRHDALLAATAEHLLGDERLEVRRALAGNRQVPGVLLALLMDDDEEVRIALAGNPSLDLGLLEVLAASPVEGVRAQLAGNSRRTLRRRCGRNLRGTVAFVPTHRSSWPATPTSACATG